MAKLNSAAVIVLLCLFALCSAQTSPQKDGNTTTADVSFPISESIPALRLPSEDKTDADASVPLTKATFRPINRRFRSKRRCHHQRFRFHPTVRRNEEIPYGNDMIVSTGENGDFENPVIPRQWVRTHDRRRHDDENDSDSDESDSDSDEDEDRTENYHGSRVTRLKSLRKIGERKKRCGFVKKLRKFLEHYF